VPHIDLALPLVGSQVPSDHGYPLYAAISRALPGLHGATWLAVHPISGRAFGDGTITLTRGARLRLRMPIDRIGDALPLAGRRLDVEGSALQVGAPTVQVLEPATSVVARLVVIKLTHFAGPSDPDRDAVAGAFSAELQRQLAKLGIAGAAELRARRSIRVAGRRVVGFAVRVSGMTPEQSLRLLEHGVGGKRRMGCGVFQATRGGTDG